MKSSKSNECRWTEAHVRKQVNKRKNLTIRYTIESTTILMQPYHITGNNADHKKNYTSFINCLHNDYLQYVHY